MKITFDTENPEDVARVRQLLDMMAHTSTGTATSDYVAFINERGSYPQRRPYMVEFIRLAVENLGLKPEVQPASSRVMLKAGNTPVAQMPTSGRVVFRVLDSSTADGRSIERTSRSDTKAGWGIQVFLDSADELEAALVLAGEAASPFLGNPQ